VWGGEDIHVGVYESSTESIFLASRRTIDRMLERVRPLMTESRVLDLGGGYGGTARLLAQQFGCHVTVVNLSEKENERNRQLCAENGLTELVEVRDGSFQSLPLPDVRPGLVAGCPAARGRSRTGAGRSIPGAEAGRSARVHRSHAVR
jgi:sarcosine/dimethylglycine N-methyltransferase